MKVKDIPLELNGASAKIFFHEFRGTPTKTLMITFPKPWTALSSLDGFKKVRFICNNFIPPKLQDFVHNNKSRRVYLKDLLSQLQASTSNSAILFTGVDVEDVGIAGRKFREFKVYAFVTAGVDSNAMRVGVDRAGSARESEGFRGVGTVNIILVTNASLSTGAMVSSIITITEAKTIAFQDLDVRSSYNPKLQATGTGTDGVIVASGDGPKVTYVGGARKGLRVNG